MTSLRQRLRIANKLFSSPQERYNPEGTVTVDTRAYMALLELRALVPELDNALWKLEELEKEQAKWVTIPRMK